jgi:hypothetical protein
MRVDGQSCDGGDDAFGDGIVENCELPAGPAREDPCLLQGLLIRGTCG